MSTELGQDFGLIEIPAKELIELGERSVIYKIETGHSLYLRFAPVDYLEKMGPNIGNQLVEEYKQLAAKLIFYNRK